MVYKISVSWCKLLCSCFLLRSFFVVNILNFRFCGNAWWTKPLCKIRSRYITVALGFKKHDVCPKLYLWNFLGVIEKMSNKKAVTPPKLPNLFIGDTSSHGCFFHCHVSFGGLTVSIPVRVGQVRCFLFDWGIHLWDCDASNKSLGWFMENYENPGKDYITKHLRYLR